MMLFEEASEVDPSKMSGTQDESLNALTLQLKCQKFHLQIMRSANLFPFPLCKMLQVVESKVSAKFPNAVQTALGGFVFLRFINPAICNPETYGMHPGLSDRVRREVVLITKVLQNLANQVEFGAKEPFMAKLNSFIVSNRDELAKFYRQVTTNPQRTDKNSSDVEVPLNIKTNALLALYNQYDLNQNKVFDNLRSSKDPKAEESSAVLRNLLTKLSSAMAKLEKEPDEQDKLLK